MPQKKKGIFSRLIEGPEISEEKARAMLPNNRWELGMDIFKTNFSKLVGINLLTLLFVFLVFAVILVKPLILVPLFSQLEPFSANLGIGYPSITYTVGLSQSVDMQSTIVYLLLPVISFIASIGISGGMYVMRNLVWSEGVFLKTDFWQGVKKNYGQISLVTFVYTLIVSLIQLSLSSTKYYLVFNSGAWYMSVSNVIAVIFLIFSTIVYMYAVSMSVTYKLTFKQLIRNATIMSIGLLPTNLFFALFALLPFLLFLINFQFLQALLVTVVLIFGLSFLMLVWTNYTQWAFDKYVNDKVPGAKKNRGIYNRVHEEGRGYRKTKLKSKKVKPITDTEIEIMELPETFSRKDLIKLEESKENMRKDSDLYKEAKPQADQENDEQK